MQVVAKNINDYTRELKVDLTWEEVQPNFNKAAKAFSKKIKMPGFRPGRVPMERLLSQFQANIEAEFLDAKNNFSETDQHITEVKQDLGTCKSQKEKDLRRLEEVRTELDSQRIIMSEKESVRLTLHEKLNQAESRLSSIQEIADRYERSPEGVRAVMTKALPKEGEADDNIFGLVADLLDVPKDLELPVEAALSRRLQAVVVNDAQTALDYARYLQQENHGRADFYVLQDHAAPAADVPENFREWSTPMCEQVKSRKLSLFAEMFTECCRNCGEVQIISGSGCILHRIL